jgi:hypothetical protein
VLRGLRGIDDRALGEMSRSLDRLLRIMAADLPAEDE